jgi:hypothetical protein
VGQGREICAGRHTGQHEGDWDTRGTCARDIGFRAITNEQRPIGRRTRAFEREADEVRLGFPNNRRTTPGRDLDRREDRSGSRQQSGGIRIGGVPVCTDQRDTVACDVSGPPDVLHHELRVPRHDDRRDVVGRVRRHEAFRPYHLPQAARRADMHAVPAAKTDAPEMLDDRMRGRDDIGRLGRDAHAHQLRRVVARRARGVVRHEHDALVTFPERGDGLCGAVYRLVTAPHDAVEVDEERIEPVGEYHALSSSRCGGNSDAR